jgi:hypothetical protein
MRLAGIATLGIVLALGAIGTTGAAPLRLLPPPRTAAVDCDDAAGAAVIPRGAISANHFHIAPGNGSHYNTAARRYTGKFPAAVSGRQEVTVSVPPRLRARFRIGYAGSGLATEIAFEPCPGKPATFFPGGLVFRKLEPLFLNVSVEGSDDVRRLRLGVIHPR